MSYQPIQTIQNQVPNLKNASPLRFSTQDSTSPWPAFNATIDQTLWFLPIVRIPGSKMDILAHDTKSLGPDAAVVDLSLNANVTAEVPYITAAFSGGGASRTVELRQYSGRVDVQTYADIVASEQIQQTPFQTEGKLNPLRKLVGSEFIVADGLGGRMLGLNQQGTDGYAQTITAGTGSVARCREALKRIRTNDQRLDNLFFIVNNETYWDVVADAEGKSGTVPIEFEKNDTFGIPFPVLHYAKVPFCINDFIPVGQGSNIYLADRTNLYAIVNERAPEPIVRPVKREDESGTDIEVTWWINIVSETDLGLVISTP